VVRRKGLLASAEGQNSSGVWVLEGITTTSFSDLIRPPRISHI
jgi:hypothetical protein